MSLIVFYCCHHSESVGHGNLFLCITWNGISLELDCSIAARETCNLDSLSTLDHLTSLAFLYADVSTARLCPVNHLTHVSNLHMSVLQKGRFCQLLLTHYLDSDVLQ